MIRIQQRLLSFSIVSQKIAHNSKELSRDPTMSFYPVVGLKDIKLGTMVLNQPNNQNFLTEEMMGEIFRFLNSYHHDHTVENIWVQNKGSMFLGGISFQQLANNPQYLDKLYKMITLIAKVNKPIFSLVSGGVRNVGAYVLSMATVALTDHTSTLRFDEVSKGFIPVAGGSHRLSRLPVNLGYFLALTGKRLTSDQMARLGFITGSAKEGVSSKQMRSVISKSNLFFREKVRYYTFDKRENEFQEWEKILKKQQDFKNQTELNQVDILNSNQNVFAKFAMNQYTLAQFNYENTVNPYNSFSDKQGRQINNYYAMRHQKAIQALKKQGLIETAKYDHVRLPGFEIDKILKFFQRDSIIEVVKALEADESHWAKQTLKHLRQMDPLAATLTFELLKRAQTLSWDQCLDLQYTVGKRLLANSKLQLKETYGGSKSVLVNQYSQGKIQDIPLQSVIEEYFKPAVTEQEILQRDVPLYSLLPNRDYFNIPDSARLALNQQFFDDIHITNQEIEMKRWLEREKINYRHKSYEINLLREKIYQKEEYDLVKSNQSKRLEYIINNSRVLNNFIDERFNLLDNMTDSQLQKFLNEMITKVFNNGIESRFEEFKKTAAIIGKQKKLQIFKNLRKTLVKKIVLNGIQVEQDNIEKNQSFKGPIYFNETNKSIYETKNPYLKIHKPLEKLAEEISEKRQITAEFADNEGAYLVDRNLGLGNQTSKRQNYLKRVSEKVAKRYGQIPQVWNRAYQYKEMVIEAAKTSEQIAQYLEWAPVDFYNTVLNAPATQKTYAELGQQIVEKIETERQTQRKAMLTQQVLSQVYSEQFFSQVYQSKPQSTYKSVDYIKQQIIPKFALTKELQKFMGPILQQVLTHFQEKYFAEALKQKKIQFGEFDQYIYQGQDKDFIEFYKNDILFVYSYLAILRVKEVLHNLKVNGIPQKPEELLSFFRQYNIEFLPDRTVQFMNKILSKFLFQMLDLHTYTKAKIQLPQNKLLDFLNRTKIYRETQKRSLYPLSFQSLLLMIGKDRSKLYNKIVKQFIPSEPQYLLEMANLNERDQLNDEAKGSIAPNLYLYQNNVTDEHLQKKNLVSGYQFYLGLFDSFIHRAGGKYNFINDHILSLDSKLLKGKMENIINLKQTPQQWLKRCGQEAIKKFFNGRLQFEKNLTKGQLLAFDQQMREVLTPQGFRMAMKFILQSEIQQTKTYFSNTRKYTYGQTESERHQERYCEIRRSVKNPDAFKRLNNLNLAIQVQKEYYGDSQRRKSMEEQKEDLVEEKKEFQNYERFPKETYRRMNQEVFNYGEEKNFDKYLNPINERHMDHKTASKKLHFVEDDRIKMKKQEKFTDFDEEIKLLRTTITKNSTVQELDSIYKKIEELL